MRMMRIETRQARLRARLPYASGESIYRAAFAQEHADMNAWIPGHASRCWDTDAHVARRQSAPEEARRRRAFHANASRLNSANLREMRAAWPDDIWQARALDGILRGRDRAERTARARMTVRPWMRRANAR